MTRIPNPDKGKKGLAFETLINYFIINRKQRSKYD